MRRGAVVAFVVMALSLGGCARSLVTYDFQGDRVAFSVGTTPTEIRAALGPPAEIRAGPDGTETWVYPATADAPARVLGFRRQHLAWLKHLEPGT